jgi:3,2-trans-enoyl-CoA isomerase
MWAEEVMINRLIHGDVHVLRLNRPPVNALSPDLLRLLAEEVRHAPERGAKALILTGGEGMFSAGLDVPLLLALDRKSLGAALVTFFDAIESLASSAVPLVAAITGHSPAGGAVLALCCDWRVMAAGEYTIGLNEVRIGIPIPDVVAALATHAVGPRVAESLCVSGRLVAAEEALRIGLIDEVAPMKDVVDTALRWCERLIEAPAQALTDTRSVVRRNLVEAIRSCREEDTRRLADLWFQPELQSAMRALVERLKGN